MRSNMAAALFLVLLGTTGCLTGETTHTILIEPDLSATWIVEEDLIRSTEEDPQDRRQEEEAYLRLARSGRQPVAEGLDALDPRRLRVEVLRSERPFTVRTVARFGPVDALARRWLEVLEVPGHVRMEEDGEARTLRLVLSMDGEAGGDSEDIDLVAPLLADAGDYRVLLTSGRFVDATGFDIDDDRTLAVPSAEHCTPAEPHDEETTTCVFALTWVTD